MKFSFILLTFFSFALKAQTLDIKWSGPMMPDKIDGKFRNYVYSGYSPQYVYAVYSPDKGNVSKVAAFDKNTLKKVSICDRVDWESKKMNDFSNGSWLVLKENYYFFYYKQNKKSKDFYVQIFDVNLKPISDLKKVDGISRDNDIEESSRIFVAGNKIFGEKIIIGKNVSPENGKTEEFEYKIYDSQFNLISEKRVTLPFTADHDKNLVTSTYKFGVDGNIHIETNLILYDEYPSKKGESRTNLFYSVINVNTGNVKSFPIKSEGKNLFQFHYVENEKSIKLFGFFTDISKGNQRPDIHGVYYGGIDSKTLEMDKKLTYSYFTKEQENELFAKVNSFKGSAKLTKKGEKYSQEEPLSEEYKIEDVQFINNESIVLFCSVNHDYLERVMAKDNGSNYNTSFNTVNATEDHCVKRNVGAIKINMNGEIEWASSLKRFIEYRGYTVSDLMVINKEGKFYVIYGSDGKDALAESKGKDDGRDMLEYAVFDYSTGKYEVKNYTINTAEIEKKLKKNFNVLNIEVIDNEFYTSSQFEDNNKLPAYLGKFIVIK